MKVVDARLLAVEAVARGWITPEQLWDAAARWFSTHGAASTHELFEDILTRDQIESLVGQRRDADTIVSPSVPDVPSSMSLLPGAGQPYSQEGPRYTLRDHLGRGGTGDVVSALDRRTRRVVALKTLQAPYASDKVVAARFIEEARVTAQLEHPGIIPIYDVGVMPDGQPFYTMRVVKRRTLRDVYWERQNKRSQWSRVRLLGVLVQVARALAYAHSRGVIHRDVKPENVLIGDFGEVYLADWGLAKVSKSSTLELHGDSAPPPDNTEVAGTPGYISPEAIRSTNVDHRTDLYALGMMLYEVLVGHIPFDGEVETVLRRTLTEDPPRPSSLLADCPLLLDDLCMSLVAREPDERPESADAVAAQIEAFLEGDKERERRREEAITISERAKEPLRRYKHLENERTRLRAEADAILRLVKPFDPIEKKRAGWALEDLADKAEREAGLVLAEAIELYTKALGYDPTSAAAHKGLAELYWSRARSAEGQRRPASVAYYEALVREHDDGRYAAIMTAHAYLSLSSIPSGAHVIATRSFERDRVLIPGGETYLGITPLREAKLEPGSWLLTIKHPGHRDVRYPVLLGRGAHHEGTLNLYTDEEIGEDFVYIPGGPAIVGGDPEAYDPLPRQEVDVGDFAIARFPVTHRQYSAFLDDLDRNGPDLALKRAPHDMRGSEGLCARRGANGWEPDPVIIEGEARKHFPPEAGHLWNVPVGLVDWFDAVAYCRWRSKVEGVTLRLPRELEWEKASRGVDGRFYPWGDRFDSTFCKVRDSRPYNFQPEPVGTFPIDESPYGVRDLAGNFRQWMADIAGGPSLEELMGESEPAPDVDRGASSFRRVRGGIWNGDYRWARSASRSPIAALSRGTGLGFRLAKDLPKRA